MDNDFEEYEPTEKEWAEIEESIMREEEEEEKEAIEKDRIELEIFKVWLKGNGMSWDRKDAPNVKKRRR